MAKITLASILTAFASAVSLNSRFSDVETHLNDKVLYRDNVSGEANEMKNDLDMNSNRILNLPSPVSDQEPARWVDVKDGVSGIAEVVPSAVGNEDKALSSSGTGLVYKKTTFRHDTVAAMTADTSTVLGQVWECEDYVSGNNAGILTFKVVAAATGTADGGSYFDHDSLPLQFERIFNSIVSVADFGAVGDGVTDDTVAIQLAVTTAEANRSSVLFPSTVNGYVSERVDIKTGGIKIYGDHTKIIHKYDTVVAGSGGAGTTKAWPVFMIYRDANYTEITGFEFVADSSIATVSASVPGWESYLSHIVSHNADRTWIHHNKFAGTQDRAIFFHGGDYAKVHDNDFTTMGMIMHVGFAQNQNFWDTGANDQTTWFSPRAPVVKNNHFNGYAGTLTAVLFMTGCTNISVKDNKLTGMNQSGATGIKIYSNDFGLTDNAGAPQLIMGGEVAGNTVEGVFQEGLILDGYSSNATSQIHQLRLEVHGNTITGTGNGIDIERCNFTKIHDNQVSVTGSPLLMTRDVTSTNIDKNNFEGTTAGNNTTTLWSGSTLTFDNSTLDGNNLTTPVGDNRVLNVTGTSFDNSSVSYNKVSVASTISTPIPFNITVADSSLRFNGNEFTITGSSMVDRPLFVLSGTANIEADGNKVISSSVQLDRSDITCANLQFNGNTVPGLLGTCSGKVFLSGNTLVGATSGTTQPVKLVNAPWASVTHNYIESPVALGVASVQFVDCAESRFISNRLIGNSSVPLVRADDAVDLKYWGNEQTNNGAGGVTYTTSGVATAVAETGT